MQAGLTMRMRLDMTYLTLESDQRCPRARCVLGGVGQEPESIGVVFLNNG